MKVVGLITEYNPFHNGHLYHINQSKELTGADYVVVVMSGNFVQRGTPAITDKYTRAKMALACGADLVLELPVCFATGSAEFFAHGAVSILHHLGFVDSICFGSECGSIPILSQIADFLLDEPVDFKETLTTSLKSGNTYPAARMHAMMKHFHSSDEHYTPDILSSSNNILGIEYIKALIKLNSPMIPYTITRKSNQYHDKELDETGISSATSLRASYETWHDLNKLKPSIPDRIYSILKSSELLSFPIVENDCSDLLYYKLLQEEIETLTSYADISEDLAKRIMNLLPNYTNFTDFALLLKSKQYTLTRINRAFLHILLNIKAYPAGTVAPYIRVLGLKKQASQIIRNSTIEPQFPIITKVADAKNHLDSAGLFMLQQDIQAANVYNRIVYSKFGTSIANDYQHGIVLD